MNKLVYADDIKLFNNKDKDGNQILYKLVMSAYGPSEDFYSVVEFTNKNENQVQEYLNMFLTMFSGHVSCKEKYPWWDIKYNKGRINVGYIFVDYINKTVGFVGDPIKINYEHETDEYKRNFVETKSIIIDTKTDKKYVYDIFFRGKDEVPEDYNWDGTEEYEGWLRYRWGDHGNALEKMWVDRSEDNIEEASEEDIQNYMMSQETEKQTIKDFI